MLLQVHDELLFEVPRDEVEMTERAIQTEMESVAQLDVPLVLDVGIGYNWEEAH